MILESLPAIHMCFITLAPEDRVGDFTGDERLREWHESFRKVGGTCAHEEARMVDWLWREDFPSPRSIDISIYGTTGMHTTFEFLVAGVFSRPAVGDAAYLPDRPLAPWAGRPPRVPPGWTSVRESGRFSINWHKKDATHAA